MTKHARTMYLGGIRISFGGMPPWLRAGRDPKTGKKSN